MTRKLKILVMATFAVSAVMASSAHAEEEIEAEAPQKVILTGTQVTKNVFKTTAGNIECNVATYTGTIELPATEATLTPTFDGCTCIGLACVADLNGCDFLLKIGAVNDTVDLVCPAGKQLTFTAGAPGTVKCTIHYPPQANLGVIVDKNIGVGATQEVVLELNLANIAYTHTKGTGIGACVAGAGANGTLQGTIQITAEEDKEKGAHVGIFIA